MVAAELFGALEYVVKNAIRIQDTYKKRPDGSTRAFGGVNVAMFVDFWQLQPVAGTWFCANPLEIPAGRAQDALWMLWGSGLDTIRSHWELSEIMRCKDIWYNEFLHECRNGNLQKDMYSFFHGLPTLVASLPECSCTGGNDDVVADPILGRYNRKWAAEFLTGSTDMSILIASSECTKCKQIRRERLEKRSIIEIIDVT